MPRAGSCAHGSLSSCQESTVCTEHPSKCVETPGIRTGKDQKQTQGIELPPIPALRCVPQQLSPEKVCGLNLFSHCAAFSMTLLKGSFPAVSLHQSCWSPTDLKCSKALCSWHQLGMRWRENCRSGCKKRTLGSQNRAQAAQPAVIFLQNTDIIWNKGTHSPH